MFLQSNSSSSNSSSGCGEHCFGALLQFELLFSSFSSDNRSLISFGGSFRLLTASLENLISGEFQIREINEFELDR